MYAFIFSVVIVEREDYTCLKAHGKHSNMESSDAEGAMGFRIGCRLFQSNFACHLEVEPYTCLKAPVSKRGSVIQGTRISALTWA